MKTNEIAAPYREVISFRPLSPWRDTHVEVRGPAALAVQLAFVEDWYRAKEHLPRNWIITAVRQIEAQAFGMARVWAEESSLQMAEPLTRYRPDCAHAMQRVIPIFYAG